jgi:hypothetical protein
LLIDRSSRNADDSISYDGTIGQGVSADVIRVFAAAVRMTARLPKTQPQLARIFQRVGYDLVAAPRGLSARLPVRPASGAPAKVM